MKTYEEMLEEGISKLPKEVIVTERFEIPKAKGHIQGNKTVITNFNNIIEALRRDKDHFLKFLLKELATPGVFDGPRLVIGRKVSASLINAKIQQYAEMYVLCSNCGKPDTQIIEKEGVNYLKCTACGTQKQIRK
ncbi:MAG TPA: translation initiation factor IF-2 subunit beta [Candidatus Nanoarchaeia archaeon]|nr:translation initiation factor IF-2 subunit beta [Candidatus Nanoarchaeia archaeon]